MRNGFLGSLVVALACAGSARAQVPYSYPSGYAQPYYQYGPSYPYGGYYPAYPYQPYSQSYATVRVPGLNTPAIVPYNGGPYPDAQQHTTGYRKPKLLGWPPPAEAPQAAPGGEVIVESPGPGCASGSCGAGGCDTSCPCDEGHCPVMVAPPNPPPPECPRSYHWYGSAEVLLWKLNRDPTPPLVTDGVNVYGNNLDFDNREFVGGRFTLGGWLDPTQVRGIEATYLFLQQRNPTFNIASGNLAVPFNDALTGAPAGVVLAAPGVATGSATLHESTRLMGGEVNLRNELARWGWGHFDFLTGVRYLDLQEALDVNTQSTGAVGGMFLGPTTRTMDTFATRNVFLGGQLGLSGEVNYGRLFFNSYGKVALGNVRERVNIGGSTVLTAANGMGFSFPGGIFAQPTNIGSHTRNEFAVLPEVGANVGYRITDFMRIYAGYTFLYLNRTVRPGAQIDTTVNPSQTLAGGGGLVGPARPAFAYQDHTFWAQGVNIGLEFRY